MYSYLNPLNIIIPTSLYRSAYNMPSVNIISIKHYKSQFNVYFNSPVKYPIAGKYNLWKLNFLQWQYFDKPVESKTQFTKYLINVNCGKQQIYRFGPGLNFNVKYLH